MFPRYLHYLRTLIIFIVCFLYYMIQNYSRIPVFKPNIAIIFIFLHHFNKISEYIGLNDNIYESSFTVFKTQCDLLLFIFFYDI